MHRTNYWSIWCFSVKVDEILHLENGNYDKILAGYLLDFDIVEIILIVVIGYNSHFVIHVRACLEQIVLWKLSMYIWLKVQHSTCLMRAIYYLIMCHHLTISHVSYSLYVHISWGSSLI